MVMTDKNPDKMSERELRNEVKQLRSKVRWTLRQRDARVKMQQEQQIRADKYENMLIKINGLIFAKGISYTGDDYWTVRGMCAEAERAKAEREKD
jgi:hypothetical protein